MGPVRLRILALPRDPGPWIRRLEPWASTARRERAGRYRFPADRLRCLGAEALLRHALRECQGLEDPEVALDGRGKPFLPAHPDVHFSLAHSGSWILCALSGTPVGVDVEEAPEGGDLPAGMVLSAPERARLAALPPGEARACLVRMWTLKESLLKAMGLGLSLDPATLDLRVEGPRVRALHPALDLGVWRLAELSMPPGAAASLCWRDP
jgi:4'-phosphopantetheinyl transferase